MGLGVFLSTYEKQLDAKRRLLVPGDFRTAENGAEHGIFLFPSIEADCLEAGGDHLFAVYNEMIQSLPFGSEERSALEWQVMGEQVRLSYDSGGRITLPDYLCAEAELSDSVVIVGLNDRFQIWSKAKWMARRAEQRAVAKASLSQIGKLKLQAQMKLGGGE
nr:division/cell wall cluster transcriptional repressor MraZ [Brevundimonas pishanensis]